jgi:hypothetical protein
MLGNGKETKEKITMKARMKPMRTMKSDNDGDEGGLEKKSLKLDKIARKWAGRSAPNVKKLKQKIAHDKEY